MADKHDHPVDPSKHNDKKPFKILALDGGGVRAIIQAVVLARLAKEYPTFIEEIDMFAGVSAGSIVALALSNGLTPLQTVELWEQEAGKIFTEGWARKIRTLEAFGACYNTEAISSMLHNTLGNKTLQDIQKKILVPSFKLDSGELNPANNRRWAPEFFHNFPCSPNKDAKCVDVCLHSTAAPTYFPIHQGYVDGGVFANNPALAAMSVAVAEGIPRKSIAVFSISTGNNPKFIPKETVGTGDWGLYEWGPHLIDLLLDGTTQSIDFQCKLLLEEHYHRLDPILPFNAGLDQASMIPKLEEVANQVDLTATKEWLETHWLLKPVQEQATSDGQHPHTEIPPEETTTDYQKKEQKPEEQIKPGDWRCAIQ